MKLFVDTSRVQFTVTKATTEKKDQNGVQKLDRNTREPLWVVQVMALDDNGGEMLNITVAGTPPKVTVGQTVSPVELEAMPWATNGRNGVAFRAQELKIQTAQAAKAA